MNRDWSPLGGARPKKVENEMGGGKQIPRIKMLQMKERS